MKKFRKLSKKKLDELVVENALEDKDLTDVQSQICSIISDIDGSISKGGIDLLAYYEPTHKRDKNE